MAGAAGNSKAPITNINVTPLVDITLVLLIIFMVTATIITAPQIPIELPKAATGQRSEAETFTVVVTKTNELFLDGRPTTETEIGNFIDQRLKNEVDLQVVISADRDALHGNVVRVIDLMRSHNVQKFAINVEPADEEKDKK
jgi:biopolymer transport protein ExbD